MTTKELELATFWSMELRKPLPAMYPRSNERKWTPSPSIHYPSCSPSTKLTPLPARK